MNIQPGKFPPPSAGLAASRAAPPRGASAPIDTDAPPPPLPVQAQAPAPMQAPLTNDAVRQIANQVNDYLKSSSSTLEFIVDGDSKKVVVRIVNAQTNEVIRQIPSEEMIAISKALDRMSGLLLQQKV